MHTNNPKNKTRERREKNVSKVPIDKSLIRRIFIHEYLKCQQFTYSMFSVLFIKQIYIRNFHGWKKLAGFIYHHLFFNMQQTTKRRKKSIPTCMLCVVVRHDYVINIYNLNITNKSEGEMEKKEKHHHRQQFDNNKSGKREERKQKKNMNFNIQQLWRWSIRTTTTAKAAHFLHTSRFKTHQNTLRSL